MAAVSSEGTVDASIWVRVPVVGKKVGENVGVNVGEDTVGVGTGAGLSVRVQLVYTDSHLRIDNVTVLGVLPTLHSR